MTSSPTKTINSATRPCIRFVGNRFTYGPSDEGEIAARLHAVCTAAVAHRPTLCEWLRRSAENEDGEPHWDTALLSACIGALSTTSDAELPTMMARWAETMPAAAAVWVAWTLHDAVELAPVLLGKPEYRAARSADDHEWLRGLGHILWLARRRDTGLPVDGFEHEILDAIPGHALVVDEPFRRMMVEALRRGTFTPPTLMPAAIAALDTDHWLAGVIVLLRGTFPQQELALDRLRRGARETERPGALTDGLLLEGGNGLRLTGALAGEGFDGDDGRARLVPLARDLLRRGVWPQSLPHCLRPAPSALGAPLSAATAEQALLHAALRELCADANANVARCARGAEEALTLAPDARGAVDRALKAFFAA